MGDCLCGLRILNFGYLSLSFQTNPEKCLVLCDPPSSATCSALAPSPSRHGTTFVFPRARGTPTRSLPALSSLVCAGRRLVVGSLWFLTATTLASSLPDSLLFPDTRLLSSTWHSPP